jgi:hypothetical protein
MVRGCIGSSAGCDLLGHRIAYVTEGSRCKAGRKDERVKKRIRKTRKE